MRKIVLFLLIPLCGCVAGYNLHHLSAKGNGTFTYNGIPVTGNVQLDSWTCVGLDGGKCPSIIQFNGESINASDTRPETNTTK